MNRPDPTWKAFHDGFEPDNPLDERVICWYCRHWTHNLQLPIHHPARPGEPERIEWRTVRCCEKTGAEGRLGFDPLIPRRCDHYVARPPQYRVKLPDGSFPRGWKSLPGAPPKREKN